MLIPPRFWDGKHANLRGQMGCQHKGGVEFGYRTPQPWLGRESREIPKASTVAATCVSHGISHGIPGKLSPGVTTTAGSRVNADDRHVPWVSLDTSVDLPCNAVGCKDRDHCLGDWFGESPDYDEADYASTVEPDSDEESLCDLAIAATAANTADKRTGIPIDPCNTADNDCINRDCLDKCVRPSVMAAALPAVIWVSPEAPNSSAGGSHRAAPAP